MTRPETPRERISRLMAGRPRPLVMAHRGNSVRCPENTLAAFRQALADGAEVIETDLHLTADGALVCIHDATVDRTTNGSGAVRELTVRQLKALGAAYGRPEFAAERIPLLDEVLTLLPDNVGLGLELKSDDFLNPAVCRQLKRLVDAAGVGERAFILSFSRERLAAIRNSAPELAIGLITLFRLIPPAHGEFAGPLWPILFANPLYVWLAHRQGQLVCPLDPTPEPRLWYYRMLGCDAVLTNDPAATRRALGR